MALGQAYSIPKKSECQRALAAWLGISGSMCPFMTSGNETYGSLLDQSTKPLLYDSASFGLGSMLVACNVVDQIYIQQAQPLKCHIEALAHESCYCFPLT
eukprot:SAG11_NODE_222_length_12140_cov_26.886554_5_plen_100_part_00